MTAAEGYRDADKPEPTGEELLADLAEKMRQAAREVRGPAFQVKGAEVWGEWPEAT